METGHRAPCQPTRKIAPAKKPAIETGKYDPSLPLAFAMARLFNLAIEEIFSDDHESGQP